jgi:DnaK suppressor protein
LTSPAKILKNVCLLQPQEVETYSQRLLEKQGELAESIARLKRDELEPEGAEPRDYGDKAFQAYAKESVLLQLEQDRAILNLIRQALARAAAGAYGKCAECGQAVEKKRVEAVPWARHCIACQELQDKGLL